MAIVNLANALSERNFDVEILCTYHIGEPAYPLKSNITLRYLTKEKPNKTEFKRALQKKNPFLLLKESIHAVRILYHKKKTMKNALSQIENGVVISTRNEHSLLLSKFGKPGVLKVAQLHNDHQFDKKLISSNIFSERIVQLLSDSSLRQKMEMAAKKRAEYFYEDRVLQQWLALLQQ